MNWAWLTSPFVLLVAFVASVMGIWGFSVRDLAREIRARYADVPAVEQKPVPAQTKAVSSVPSQASLAFAPATSVIVLPSAFGGGAVPTTGFVGMGFSGPQYALTTPDAGTDWFGLTSMRSAGAGTAATA